MKFVRSLNLSSPCVVFSLVWLIFMTLYDMRIISYYLGLNWQTIILVLGSIGCMALSWIIIRIRYKHWKIFSVKDLADEKFDVLECKIRKLFRLWVAGIGITIVLQGGFPMLWLIMDVGKDYKDFGLPSIHGFLNAIYYICILGYFLLYLKKRESKYIKMVLLLLLYPILSISRAVFIIAVFEMLGLYLFLYRIRTSYLIRLSLFMIAFIVLFGAIGDLRVGEAKNVVYALVDDKYKDVFERLPSGITWVYLYSTGSIDNVVFNINDLHPLYYPYYSIKPFIPSVIQNIIFKEKDYEERYVFQMHNRLFNTFSFFAYYLKDYGVNITIFIVFLIGLFSNYVYVHARFMKLNFIMIYPIIFMFLLLSVFSNFMVSLPILCQMIISYKYLKI